jgi:hypothetical protein
MQPFANDFLALLHDLHAAIERAIDGLPQDALDWSPGPDINSIAVLVVHIAGAERYLLGDVVAREPSNRDRPAEFQTSGLDVAALKDRLVAATDYARHVLGSLTLQDLETMRESPRDGREHTVAWWITHAVDHTAQHLGHIELTRHWWEQRDRSQ